uniref:Uncharacterized protein n=1 Tax=uncultured Armatimonadetes bacterium TaxID=157466 RepID=A0A6J4IES7_9BACT|nr:hypothetical protein AVDCRST_MAG63-1791 [uncultured Armatimonadetes bacterium]
MRYKAACLMLGAVVAPFLTISAYLYFSRWPTRWFTATSDYIGLGLSVAAGMAFLLRLPVLVRWRALAAVVYLPTIGAALVFYSLMFVGAVFNDWL